MLGRTVTIASRLVGMTAELAGDEVEIKVQDGLGGTVVYLETVPLDASSVLDWYGYFFEPFSTMQAIVRNELPPYLNAHITVTISGSATVAIGQCLVGSVYTLGATQYGATAGIRDYSRKAEDATTGYISLEQRHYAKLLEAKFFAENGAINAISQLLADVRSVPVVWQGDNGAGYEPLIVYGYYKDFRLDVAYPENSYYTLQIEGMI